MGSNLLKIGIIVLSLLVASAASAVEVLQNGGFETGELAPWEKIGEPNTWTVSDEYVLEGMYSGLVQGADQLGQSFEPRLGANIEVFSFAAMTGMGGAYIRVEIQYTDAARPTVAIFYVPVAYRWYAYDLRSRIDPNREVCRVVLTGHGGGDTPEKKRTWFDAITLQNNQPDDPVDPPAVDDVEVIDAVIKKIKVLMNLKKERTLLNLALKVEEGIPEGIQEGPVEIRVQLTQEGLTTEFRAVAELVDVPRKKDHIIQLMDLGSAEKVSNKK
jgi:hypothetical protein